MVGVVLGLGGLASAQPKKDAPPKQEGPKPQPAKEAPKQLKVSAPTDMKAAIAALSGANLEEAAKSAASLGVAPQPAAHDALLDALAMGLPPEVAVPAVAALAQHPAPPDVAALRRYAGHHNAAVRSASLAALALYPDPIAHTAVIAGLHDNTGLVRGAAAAAAAKGRIREAVEPLFQLLERGEEPAARALAALADADLARKIGDQLGHVPDASLALALGLVLKRNDFGPDPARVEVVRALAKIADPAAVSALTDYLDATPKNPPRPSRAEAQKIVDARLGGGGK